MATNRSYKEIRDDIVKGAYKKREKAKRNASLAPDLGSSTKKPGGSSGRSSQNNSAPKQTRSTAGSIVSGALQKKAGAAGKVWTPERQTQREVPEIQQPDFVRPSSSGFAGRAQNAATNLQRQAAERRGIQTSRQTPVPPQGDLLTQLTFSQLNRSRAARENAAQGKPSFADDAAKALTSLAQKAQEARANGAELPMTGVRAKDYDKTYAQNQRKTAQLDTKLNQLAGALSAEDLSRTYTRQPDFVQASAYVPAAERQRSRGTAYSGVADVVYDYVNGDKKAAATLYDANPAEFTQRYQRYSEASDKDKRVFNYIYNKYGSEAAMEYMDQAEMQFDPAEAFVYNFGQPIMSGIEGVSKLVSGLQPDEPSSRGVPYMPEETESGFDRIYNNYSRDLISAQQQQPIASTAGSIASNVAEMTMIGSGIGSLPGFARLGYAAQKILSGAASMAGTHAINEAGAVATGQISGEEYLRDITGAAIRGAAGGAGSIASGTLAGAGLDKLGQIASKFPKLKNNAIARYVAGTAGMVVEGAGFDFAEALTHIGLDPNAYPDAEAFWEDMIIGFAFSAIDYSKGRIADVGRAPVSSFAEINKAKTTEDLAAAAEILRGRYDHAKAEGDFAKAAAFDAQRRDLEADIQAKQDWITWKDNHKAINAYNELKKALHPKRAAAEGAERAYLEEAQKRFDEALDRIKKDVDASGRTEETADAIEVLEEIGGRASTAEAESGPRETIINDIAESLSLGENGKAELDAAYDGSDVSTYSREFRDAYHAGREGTALDESATEVQQRAWQAGRADAEAEAVRGAEASVSAEASIRPEETTIRSEETTAKPNETTIRPEEEARQRFESLPAEEQARIRKEEDRLKASVELAEEYLRDPKRYGLSDEEITEYQGMLKQDQASLARLEEEYGLLLHEGSERNDGARAGEQGSPVEESTGRDQSWNQEARPEAASRAESASREVPEERVESTWQLDKRAKDRSLSKLTFEDHDTNAAELGLKHGTASGRVRLVKGGETKETKRIYREAARRGISRENVVLFAGGDLSFKEGGVEFGARGACLGGKIYVRVDDADYLGSQIAIHEATHHLIATGKLNLDSVRATLAERLGGKEALEEAVALYAQAFEGMDAPADLIFEEMICDAEAGMNHFTYRGEESAREIDYSYGQIRESVKEFVAEYNRDHADDNTTRNPYKGKSFSKSREIYNYDFLVKQKDMKVVSVPYGGDDIFEDGKISRSKVQQKGIENAKSVGTERDGKVFVKNTYTEQELRIDNKSIRHSITGEFKRMLTNARLGMKIGELAQNAIPINGLRNKAADVDSTYSMVSYGRDETGKEYIALLTVEQRSNSVVGVESIDSVHSLSGRQKRSAQAANKAQGVYPITDASNTITIKDLLDVVNRTHQSVLSIDVLNHFGEQRNPNGEYSGEVLFSRRSTLEDSRRETADLQQEVNRGLEQRVKDLQKDLEKQTERANKWKRETRRTPEAEKNKVREADAKRVAGRIVKDYGSKTKAADIAPEIRELSEFVRGGGKGSASDTFAEGMAKARQIAEKVISGAEELVEIEPDADTIRSLIGRTMHIAEKDTLDIPDFEHFRRTMFGKMKLVRGTNGVTVDEAYQELSQMYPHYFPQEITHPADQVLRMADVLETIKPSLENPYSYDYALATEQVAQDIFAGIVAESNNLVQDSALRTNPPTFADKQQARYEQLIAQNKTKTAEQLARVRQQRDAAIKRLKENHTETSARARERRKATELRGQIQKQTKDMASRLLKPTDKKHFLKSVQPLVAQALDAVNMTSAFSYGADGKHVPAGEGDPTGRTKKFIALREQLQSHKEWLIEGTNLLDEGGSLQKLIDMGDKPISQMTSAELQTVHDALRDIDAVVKNADRTFRVGKTESLSASAEKMRADNIGKKPVGEKLSAGARWMHRLMLDMETPENYFHRFGKVGDQMFRELRNAQDKQTKILKESADFVKANIKVDPRKVAKQKVTVKLGGKDVTTSMAHLMELYNLCRREQGLYHVLEGGVKFSDPKRFQAAAIRNVTTDELSAAFAQLPIEYKQAADALQKYVSGDLAKHGNEASMEVFGYEKFGNDDYWQIKTDASDRKSDETQRQMNLQNTTVANWGSAKALEPNANSAVVIGDVFDSFAESVSGMANYAANLAVQQDINRLRNWKFYDEEGKRTGTMKELIDQVHGSGGGQYLEKLMADIAGGMKAEAEYFGGLTGRYKGAAVAANMRVILQQPTAIARAAELIGYKYLNEGLLMGTGKGWKKAKQWAPIAQQKEWGSVDVNTGRTVKEILFENTSPLARTNEFLMSGAAKADAFGWGLLWNACEAETRAKMPELKVGSDEYYQHVADRFTGIVDHTQVVDGILQRSQIMRNPSSLTKMATSFMGEPIKQFNQLSSAVYDARTSGTPASKKHLAKTARAMLIAGTLNAVAQSIWDAVRDDDKTKNYLEKMQSALFGIDGTEEGWTDYMKKFFSSNMGDFLNPAGYVPYVKDVVSVLQGYDVERMDLAGISGFVTAAQRMIKAMNGEGKVSTENALIGALGEGARFLGVPLANLKRDVMAVTNTVANETGNYYLQYKIADFNYRQAGNKKEFMDILYGAYKNDSDAYQLIREDLIRRDELASSSKSTEEYIDEQLRKRMNDDGNGISALYDAQKAGGKEYEEKREELVESGIFTDEQIDKGLKAQYKEGGDLDALYKSYSTGSKDFEKQYDDLLKSGVYTEKQLKDEIENRMKEEQGVTSVKDLDERFMMPAAKDAYNKDLAAVQKTSTWTNASASEREKTEKILYDIATGTKTGQKYQEKIDGGKKVGITGTEYATFLLALEVADRRGNANGSHSKDEIQAALESMTGLSQKEKAYLFGTASKAKNNPYN